MNPSLISRLEAEYLSAHYDGASVEAEGEILRRLTEARKANETLDERVMRLRREASDLREDYARHMADYGREIGRAQRVVDPTIRTLVESAARAALDEAGACLTAALAAEDEADQIASGGFVVLFDGVSARRVTFLEAAE